jgi:hypothetical protein
MLLISMVMVTCVSLLQQATALVPFSVPQQSSLSRTRPRPGSLVTSTLWSATEDTMAQAAKALEETLQSSSTQAVTSSIKRVSRTKPGNRFDVNTALFCAGLAFDSYVEPPSNSSRWERGVSIAV